MIRNSTYTTYKGYEFKLNSNHGEYTVVIPVTGLDKEIEQILIEDGFILQAYNDPRYEDYYYN
ncbi:MAG: hypothetical protein N4Q30_07180 [Neisseriaceae bacterium]|nr:hypothetical protein [Neisseriaceae bacterium]